jgi:pimeloyl-ACP methyl ester carboxylesterase
MDWILRLEKLSVDELIASCRKDNPAWQEAELRPWAESKKQFDYNFLQRPRGNPFENWQEVVKAIHCPTLLITANPTKGALVTPEAVQWIRTIKNNIKVVRVPRAGHNIRRENYPKYLHAVRAFLKEQYR